MPEPLVTQTSVVVYRCPTHGRIAPSLWSAAKACPIRLRGGLRSGQACNEMLQAYTEEPLTLDAVLEWRYLETVHAIGLSPAQAGPKTVNVIREGDVLIHIGLEERVLRAEWDETGVRIVTATRTLLLRPDDVIGFRPVPKAWRDLLDPAIAETRRRELVLEALDKQGRLFDRRRAEDLLGFDLDTGEKLREGAAHNGP